MGSSTIDIIDQLINQYTGCISNVQSGSIALGQELFNSIALISIAVLGLTHLLRRNIDMSDANLDLIKWLIYLNFFYAFIVNYPTIYPMIFSAINQIGNFLGSKAAGQTVNIEPQYILKIGIGIAKKMFFMNVQFNLFRNFFMVIISAISGFFILYCFAIIGLELILVKIGSQIILAGGIFLLAFAGLSWTRDYAERYVHTFFHIGIKMIFIYILVGLGIGLTTSWSVTFNNGDIKTFIDQDLEVCLAAYIYYKLCVKVPDQAVSWLTGRMALGFESATDVKAGVGNAVKTAHGAYKLATGSPAMIRDFVANRQGNKMAYDSAMKFTSAQMQAQGKNPSAQELKKETVKTLGAARWSKVVTASDGGKLATSIDEDFKKFQEEQKNLKPTPDPGPQPMPTPNTDNDSMDASI